MDIDGYKHVINSTKRWVNYTGAIDITINALLSSGRGYFQDKKIELPAWINRFDVAFRIYYAVHELTHCLIGNSHDENFKKMEDKLLEHWDLRIVRKKVYPRELYHKGIKVLNVPNSMS